MPARNHLQLVNCNRSRGGLEREIFACDFVKMTTKKPETLETKIEQMVREHLVAQEVAAKAAVERAFSLSALVKPSAPRRAAKYRSRESIAELAERLYEAICASPGETMTVIAVRVGEAARVLKQPMMRLKETGRVRSAGERNFKRYFPMALAKSA